MPYRVLRHGAGPAVAQREQGFAFNRHEALQVRFHGFARGVGLSGEATEDRFVIRHTSQPFRAQPGARHHGAPLGPGYEETERIKGAAHLTFVVAERPDGTAAIGNRTEQFTQIRVQRAHQPGCVIGPAGQHDTIESLPRTIGIEVPLWPFRRIAGRH